MGNNALRGRLWSILLWYTYAVLFINILWILPAGLSGELNFEAPKEKCHDIIRVWVWLGMKL